MFKTILTFQFMLHQLWIHYCSTEAHSDKHMRRSWKVRSCWSGGEKKNQVNSGFLEQTPFSEDFPLMKREGTWAKTASFAERRVKCPQQGEPEPGGKQMAWVRAETGLALGEQKDLFGWSLPGMGTQPQAEVAVLLLRGHVLPFHSSGNVRAQIQNQFLHPPPALNKSWFVDEWVFLKSSEC